MSMPFAMPKTLMAAVLAALIAANTPASAAIPVDANGQPIQSLATMLERVTPAVVNIATEGNPTNNDTLLNDPFLRRLFGETNPNGSERRISGTGSGVIIHSQLGHVLTNHHVIEGAEKVYITLKDGRKFVAEIVGTDPHADLAVLQIPAERLTAMRFGDSDKLRVGDFVVAIGNPYSIGQTVTSGIISALHRNPGISEYENFIQTDAPINLGNSGGPLVNLNGELIGINTAILGDQAGGSLGIGFAVPINTAAGVIAQIIEFGHVQRGQLGIGVEDIEPAQARETGLPPNQGAIVKQVLPNTPAARANIQLGDIITRINNKNIERAIDIKNIIGDLRVGTAVHIALIRAGKPKNITLTIEMPSPQSKAKEEQTNAQPFWEQDNPVK